MGKKNDLLWLNFFSKLSWKIAILFLVLSVSYIFTLLFLWHQLWVFVAKGLLGVSAGKFDSFIAVGFDTSNPLSVIYTLGSFIVWPVAVWFAGLTLEIKNLGFLVSFAGRLRISELRGSVVPALGSIGLATIFSALYAPTKTEPSFGLNFFVCIFLALVFMPIQVFAEELLFRSIVPASLNRVVKNWFFAVLLSQLLFALFHPYNVWGLVVVFIFGIFLSVVSKITGGIEFAFGYHFVNNYTFFLILSSGFLGFTTQTESGNSFTGFINILTSLVPLIVFFVWVLLLDKKYFMSFKNLFDKKV